MNDVTPRKLRGSLIERAADVYDFAEHFRAKGGATMPPASPPAVAPVVAAPKVAPAPRVAAAPLGPVVAIDRELLAEHGFLVPGAPVGALAEEFRLVKRHLLLTARKIAEAGGERARHVLVCSAKPGEGKTFCSINLALSLAAERDVEVLLVDADFAKPDVMRSLGLDEGCGLLDALADPAIDIERCIVRTDVPKLSVLPAGTRTTDDTELLSSERTDALLAGLVALSNSVIPCALRSSTAFFRTVSLLMISYWVS